MPRNTTAALSLKELPIGIREKPIGALTKRDRAVIQGMLTIKEWVQDSYREIARVMQDTIRRKRAAGYCGGFIYCLSYTGKSYMCTDCRAQKANPRYHRNMSQYGQIRATEKEKERTRRAA